MKIDRMNEIGELAIIKQVTLSRHKATGVFTLGKGNESGLVIPESDVFLWAEADLYVEYQIDCGDFEVAHGAIIRYTPAREAFIETYKKIQTCRDCETRFEDYYGGDKCKDCISVTENFIAQAEEWIETNGF